MNVTPHEHVVRALVPSAAAARSLSREFPIADLDRNGTFIAVVVRGITYSDVIARIKEWRNRTRIGPVLVTDGMTGEEFLPSFAPRRPLEHQPRRSPWYEPTLPAPEPAAAQTPTALAFQ